MRERQTSQQTKITTEWITPAYAGKTNSAEITEEVHEDHPRVCGKDIFCDD